ncbi:MAG: UDP-N-acetylglucosamine 1-carboxyvinyltransferase [Candidatus Peregrinibacteria bacterium]|nr:UDP-N-acetylglucosamine 1-carboxyvinyltransferase [Candidatus Peregrinibacteria bacterium]
MAYFEVEGGRQINGEISVSGAKNATLPMFCAALLTDEKCLFKNVPDISDVQTLLDIFKSIGVRVKRNLEEKTVEIWAKEIDLKDLHKSEKVKKFRASILLLGPLLARMGKCHIPQPGGCVIGARSNEIHTDGFKLLGVEIEETTEHISAKFGLSRIQSKKRSFKNKRILLTEASVTGTENLAIFAAGVRDDVEIFFSASEPIVAATLEMLVKMGATITGIGRHHLRMRGTEKPRGGVFEIPPDGLLVGTYAIAAALTGGELEINNVNHRELFSFYGAFKRVGAKFQMKENQLKILPTKRLRAVPKIQTAIFPGFPTDLQSPFGVLLTQCSGTSVIFETLFENRLTYLSELEKMGAKVEMLNSHQAKVYGPTRLKAAEVQSWDLRAGAAMVLAGLIAEGTTKVTNIDYIDRGYENFAENLNRLGAKIRRVE